MFNTVASGDNKRIYMEGAKLNEKRNHVQMRTCADVYQRWRATKRLYKRAPKDGIEFDVDYIDTGLTMSDEQRACAPVALLLHGAPGSYHDFTLLIDHLSSQQQVRVIAPNFPEYVATVRTKVLFRHSADEKAAYLRDFLKAIQVSKIDLLVSHSSAIFPTLLILLNANNEAIRRQQQRQQLTNSNNITQDHQTKQHTQIDSVRTTEIVVRDASQDEDEVDVEKFEDAKDDINIDDNNNNNNDGFKQKEKHARADDSGCSSSSVAGGSGGGNWSGSEADDDTLVADDLDDEELSAKMDHVALDEWQEQEQQQQQQPELEQEQTLQHTNRNSKKRLSFKRLLRKPKRCTSEVIVKFDEPIEIRAVALFNPAGHRLPKSMKPTWFKCGSVHVYQHKLGRSIFRKFGPAFLTVVGVPVRVDNMDNVMLSATVMRNSKCQRVVSQLEQLSRMRLPTLLVFSENDKLIEKEIFYEMTQFMRLDPKNFDVFNNDGDIEVSQSSANDWIRVMVFKAGGHYAYSNYAKTVNKAVSELLNRTVRT